MAGTCRSRLPPAAAFAMPPREMPDRAIVPMTSARPWPSRRSARYVMAILVTAYIFSMVDRIIMGQLAPFIKIDLDLSDTQLGLIQGLGFSVCYMMFGLLFGWATDRWVRRTVAAIGIFVWSLSTVLSGFAASFWTLAFSRVGVAIGEASLNPSASSLIADIYAPERRAKAYGFYQLGAAVGSLLAFLLSGLLLAMLAGNDRIVLPLVGPLAPWQLTFMILGLPGFAVCGWLLSMREPERREQAGATGTWGEALAFLAAHRRAVGCLILGLAPVLMSVYGWLFWIATFFDRTYGWPVSRTGIVFGLTGGICGVISAVASGWVTDWLRRRGHDDAAPRTCAIGAVGISLFGTAAALMPDAGLALVMLCFWKLCVNLPTSAVLTALNELAPNELRGKVASIYIMVMGLFASGPGSLVVAILTDQLFHDPRSVYRSLALVSSLGAGAGALVVIAGLRSFAASKRAIEHARRG